MSRLANQWAIIHYRIPLAQYMKDKLYSHTGMRDVVFTESGEKSTAECGDTDGDDCGKPDQDKYKAKAHMGVRVGSDLLRVLIFLVADGPYLAAVLGVVHARLQGERKCTGCSYSLFTAVTVGLLIARGQQPCCTSRRTSFQYVRYPRSYAQEYIY